MSTVEPAPYGHPEPGGHGPVLVLAGVVGIGLNRVTWVGVRSGVVDWVDGRLAQPPTVLGLPVPLLSDIGRGAGPVSGGTLSICSKLDQIHSGKRVTLWAIWSAMRPIVAGRQAGLAFGS